MPSALSLLQKALSDMGADGLATGFCGCGIGDLIPCGSLGDCKAAKYDTESGMYLVIEDEST